MTYLILDTESGSRHANSTLLTAYFLVVDAKFHTMGDLYLQLKPEGDDHYIVDAQGLAVNKINLVEHDRVAITCKQAKPLLYGFLKKHAGMKRLTPLGHATKGDIRRIMDNLMCEGSWEQFATYHFLDTSVILQYLRAIGKMPEDGDGSIVALANYFGVKVDGDDHDCRVDTLKTLGVFQKFVAIGKGDIVILPD
jgi:hypothetical protein